MPSSNLPTDDWAGLLTSDDKYSKDTEASKVPQYCGNIVIAREVGNVGEILLEVKCFPARSRRASERDEASEHAPTAVLTWCCVSFQLLRTHSPNCVLVAEARYWRQSQSRFRITNCLVVIGPIDFMRCMYTA